MPLVLSQVTDPLDFHEIMPMDYDAWLSPYNPQLKHFRPQLPTREEAIAYAIDRNTQKLQKNNPNAWMIKVTDTETNEIIGFAMWVLNEMNEEEGAKTVATWHPEGTEEREFAECFINGLWGFLAERVTRKHMGNIMLSIHCPGTLCLEYSRLTFNNCSHLSSPPWCRTHADSLGH
ncbi:hypothetical protein GQ44DRAFT_698130 [Phaeosphaeriaceae sp. PMI808]|nr:hypothetical protein GQ44DRAFT_698130 [Phaeosphaeriaceae sp. PMI808]